ncbi:hypothetical protein JTB14_037118 [Gonioctena quinquepunctata]|nr:hypothetical protein JTB14_037118 [Gonioctena quinquepunctata]
MPIILLWNVLKKVGAQDENHLHDLEGNRYHKKPIIQILKSSFDRNHDGYRYSYETENGILVHETGYIKHKGDKEHETLVQQGTITYHDEHGHPITLTYIADEHGFQPQGDHLPTPPPLPEANQRALGEQNHEGYGQVHEQQDEHQPETHHHNY